MDKIEKDFEDVIAQIKTSILSAPSGSDTGYLHRQLRYFEKALWENLTFRAYIAVPEVLIGKEKEPC